MELLSYLQPGWNLRLGTQRLVIDAPNECAAYDLITTAADQLAQSVARLHFKDVCIRWEGCTRPLRVVASMTEGVTPTPEIPDMVFNKRLGLGSHELGILQRMRESPKPMSICDLESDEQEWVNTPLTVMLQMSSNQATELNMRDYWAEDALAYVKRVLEQQSVLEHSYEAMLPYTKAHFNSTFEVISFGNPQRLKRLVTIHHYEPVIQSAVI